MKSQGRFEEALRILKECSVSSEEVLGPQHSLVKQRNLMLKRWQEAIEADETVSSTISPATSGNSEEQEQFLCGLEMAIRQKKQEDSYEGPSRMGFGMIEEGIYF